MAHLTSEQTDELRAELERQLTSLERSMRVTDAALEPVLLDQTTVGRLSRIDSLQNQGLTRNLQEREQVSLALLVGALRRLDAGTYGICERCGAPIAFERLFVLPEVPTCPAC